MRRIVLLIIIIWGSVISVGCTSSTDNMSYELPPPGTPTVTSDQATEIAKNVYKIKEVEVINRRHLEQDELEKGPISAYNHNPTYWVINGKDEEGTIFVSSVDIEHHFIISD